MCYGGARNAVCGGQESFFGGVEPMRFESGRVLIPVLFSVTLIWSSTCYGKGNPDVPGTCGCGKNQTLIGGERIYTPWSAAWSDSLTDQEYPNRSTTSFAVKDVISVNTGDILSDISQAIAPLKNTWYVLNESPFLPTSTSFLNMVLEWFKNPSAATMPKLNYATWRETVLPKLKTESLPRVYLPSNVTFSPESKIVSSGFELFDTNNAVLTNVSIAAGTNIVGVTSSGEIRWWKTPGDSTKVSDYLDHRGGNLVRVIEEWDYTGACDAGGGKHAGVPQYDFKLLYYRMWTDFRKYAAVSSDMKYLYIMDAGRALYLMGGASTTLQSSISALPFGNKSDADKRVVRKTAEGVHGGLLIDGVNAYLRDIAVAPNGALAYIVYEKDNNGDDVGTNPRIFSDLFESDDYPTGETGAKLLSSLPGNEKPFSLSYGGNNALYAVSETNALYYYAGTQWLSVATPEKVFRIAVGAVKPGGLAILGVSGTLYVASAVATPDKPNWVNTRLVVADVAINKDGDIAILSGQGKLYTIGCSTVLSRLISATGSITAGSKVTVGDPVQGLLYLANTLVKYGDKSCADPIAQFIYELKVGTNQFYLKTTDGNYLTVRGRNELETDSEARSGTMLRVGATTQTDDGLFNSEPEQGGAYIRHVKTGGILTVDSDGFLRTVDPTKKFAPFTALKTLLPLTDIGSDQIVLSLTAVRANNREQTIKTRTQKYQDLSATLPFSFYDNVVFIKELIFALDEKNSSKVPWPSDASQQFSAVVDLVRAQLKTSELAAYVKQLESKLAGVFQIAPGMFANNFAAVKKAFEVLSLETSTAADKATFITSLGELITNRIDGLTDKVATGTSDETQSPLSELYTWFISVVQSDDAKGKVGELADLKAKLIAPVTASERVAQLVRLANVTALNTAQLNELVRQVAIVVQAAPFTQENPSANMLSRLSPTERNNAKVALMRLITALTDPGVTGQKAKLQAAVAALAKVPLFTDFILARRSEVAANCLQDTGLWDASLALGLTKDNQWDPMQGTSSDGLDGLRAYPITSFWNVLSRWREWSPSLKDPKDRVPLEVLLKQIKASLDQPVFASSAYDAARNEVVAQLAEVKTAAE